MKTQVESETNLKAGGYEINPTTKIPRDALVAFREATSEIYGAGYKALILVGSQVVQGVNYKFIAQSTSTTRTPIKTLVEMEIYKPLTGRSIIKRGSIKDLVSDATGLGAWRIVAAIDSYPQKVASALNDLFSSIDGVGYSPLMYAAQQQVSGVNHMVYFKQTKLTNPVSYGLASVILYENLEGKIIIQSVTTIE